jgi:acetyl esterase
VHALAGRVGRLTPNDGQLVHGGARLSLREGGVTVRARSGHHCPAALLLPSGPEEEAVMPKPVDLEPQAKAVVDANADPPYLFELGPDQGRRTIDAVQSGPVKKPIVDIEDTTVPGGPWR